MNNPEYPTEVQKQLKEILGERGIGEFKPCAMLIPGLDMIYFLEKDCSHLEVGEPGSHFDILYDAHDPERVVGVQIWGLTRLLRNSNMVLIENSEDGVIVE